MTDDWILIGAGSATVRSSNSALTGRTGTIEAYAHGTVMLKLGGDQYPLPFGLGEISEIHETKGDSVDLKKSGAMPTFLQLLSDWAEANGTAGKEIKAEPLEGPGTMVWRAE